MFLRQNHDLGVMGGDWQSRCCELESQDRILDEWFFIFLCCDVVWKDPNNEKESGDGPSEKNVSESF